jgi:DNA-binding MurR/RpiR family transcriptional regulator
VAKARSGKDGNASNGAEEKIDIEAILRARMPDFSPSEQSLAAHILSNIQMLPFETGTSIAQAVGVSEMTVTRFVRGLGFENLRDLKNRLRVAVTEKDSEIDDYMARFQMREACAWNSTPS